VLKAKIGYRAEKFLPQWPEGEIDMNVISIIIGLMALIIALVGFIPLLGWLNWFVIPGAVVGLVLGLMSTKTSGRNINLVVLALAIIRLALGGGIL
jgi:hypothetical protein